MQIGNYCADDKNNHTPQSGISICPQETPSERAMQMNTSITHFTLRAPIEDVPAGAVGQLKHLDNHHVALLFNGNHPDLVFDINDTEPEFLAAIAPTVNPSMTDPPRRFRLPLAAVIALAFLTGWLTDLPPAVSKARAAVVTTTINYVVDCIL